MLSVVHNLMEHVPEAVALLTSEDSCSECSHVPFDQAHMWPALLPGRVRVIADQLLLCFRS